MVRKIVWFNGGGYLNVREKWDPPLKNGGKPWFNVLIDTVKAIWWKALTKPELIQTIKYAINQPIWLLKQIEQDETISLFEKQLISAMLDPVKYWYVFDKIIDRAYWKAKDGGGEEKTININFMAKLEAIKEWKISLNEAYKINKQLKSWEDETNN